MAMDPKIVARLAKLKAIRGHVVFGGEINERSLVWALCDFVEGLDTAAARNLLALCNTEDGADATFDAINADLTKMLARVEGAAAVCIAHGIARVNATGNLALDVTDEWHALTRTVYDAREGFGRIGANFPGPQA